MAYPVHFLLKGEGCIGFGDESLTVGECSSDYPTDARRTVPEGWTLDFLLEHLELLVIFLPRLSTNISVDELLLHSYLVLWRGVGLRLPHLVLLILILNIRKLLWSFIVILLLIIIISNSPTRFELLLDFMYLVVSSPVAELRRPGVINLSCTLTIASQGLRSDHFVPSGL